MSAELQSHGYASSCAAPYVINHDRGRIELHLKPGTAHSKSQSLYIWTDIEGVVLLEWQVRKAVENSWTLPSHPWPRQSGVNDKCLQTMLIACATGGQELQVPLEAAVACRCQLFCIGAEVMRIPEQWHEMFLRDTSSASDILLSTISAVPDAGNSTLGVDEDWTEEEDNTTLVVKLKLKGDDRPPRRTVLPEATLAALISEAAKVYPAHDGVMVAVGQSAGMSMRLDSDAALCIFCRSCMYSQLGPPLVEFEHRCIDVGIECIQTC